mmetsp:Transcript_61693/g.165960  ORF Transcript_61693/g.165960 Transcript_61693/m.165960 type:complete len:471 (+) Transcript_61693:192-1604(+)
MAQEQGGSTGKSWLRIAASCAVAVALLRRVNSPLLQLPESGALCAGVGLLVAIGCALQRSSSRKAASQDGSDVGGAGGGTGKQGSGGSENRRKVHEDLLRWSLVPSTGVLRSNTPEPIVGENELAHVKYLVMHRPTHESTRDKAGNYPYSWHMHGRKRLWEVRVQLRFKVKPSSDLYFGLEMIPGPRTESAMVKRVQGVLLAAIGRTIGKEFYHTPGDDPATTDGEVEPPAFAMPLWSLDQLDACPIGQEPDITQDLDGVGSRRTDGLKAYVEDVKTILEEISTDKVYTLCFWGVSQFIDVVNWEFRGLVPGVKLPANSLCGRPPLFVVFYQLKDDPDESSPSREGKRRHLNSQKDYYFKVALWSSKAAPEMPFLCELLGDGVKSSASDAGADSAAGCDEEVGPISSLLSRWQGEGHDFLRKAHRRVNRVLGGCVDVDPPPTQAASSRPEVPKWVKASQKMLGGCMGGGR